MSLNKTYLRIITFDRRHHSSTSLTIGKLLLCQKKQNKKLLNESVGSPQLLIFPLKYVDVKTQMSQTSSAILPTLFMY